MKNRKFLCILIALFALAVPALAVFTAMDLDATLSNLRRELFYDYRQKSKTQEQLQKKYEIQHQQMVDIVKKCNDLSLMLYSQKQDYTFDVSYALEKVTREYNDFNNNRTPYDRILANPAEYWKEARNAMGEKYNLSFLRKAIEEDQGNSYTRSWPKTALPSRSRREMCI